MNNKPMMRSMLLVAVMLLPQMLVAQVFRAVSMETVAVSGMEFSRPVSFTPDGSGLLLTSSSRAGLWLYSLDRQTNRKLTDAQGAGTSALISADGQSVIYRSVSYSSSRQRLTALEVMDLADGTQEILVAPQHKVPAYRFAGNTAMAVRSDGEMSYKMRGTTRAGVAQVPVVGLDDDLQLTITQEGRTTVLSPNGSEATYLWPSLSPDGSLILYYVSGEGAYVCALDGTDVRFVSHDCRAPQWYDDQTVIGMHDTDNSQVITSSCIMAYTLNGKSQQLTLPSTFTMYPQCNAATGKVACCTASGELVMLHLQR